MGSRALLVINGGEAQALAVGQSRDGVKVISVQGGQAVVESDGRQRSLRIGQNMSTATTSAPGAGTGASGDDQVFLTADGAGHFVTTGMINGSPARFLVDTGATMVSMGVSDAKRLRVDLESGERGSVQTANGVVPAYKVKLQTVRVGGVTLYNVDAMVHQTDMPVILLGMSFLNRMEMHRDGSTMTLKKRY
ncbi:MAG TPA: retropepsin-like aspartic protease [Rhodocyclaceae bacterium]|nr:retropepsin-like aspartic protease [Rhodocyclaceae bacterium]